MAQHSLLVGVDTHRKTNAVCLMDAQGQEIGPRFQVDNNRLGTDTDAWTDPDTQASVTWEERRLVAQSEAHAQRQRLGLHKRLEKAEHAVRALNAKRSTEREALAARAQAILERHQVSGYLSLTFQEHVAQHTRYVGPGRPGPKRAIETVETHTWSAHTRRRPAQIREFEALAGWRIYVTNAPAKRLSLSGAVDRYRQEWQPEHGFHRLKSGQLAIMPLFLRPSTISRSIATKRRLKFGFKSRHSRHCNAASCGGWAYPHRPMLRPRPR